MPKPIYIICSESGSEDGQTKSPSIFNVIEKLQFSKQLLPNMQPLLQMRITVQWMCEPEDKNLEFEFDIKLYLPPDNTVFEAGSGKFLFAGEFQRQIVKFTGFMPLVGAGIMRVQARIRRVGDTQWIVQEYPLIVEEAPTVPQAPSDSVAAQSSN
jgi:hypothetical protein